MGTWETDMRRTTDDRLLHVGWEKEKEPQAIETIQNTIDTKQIRIEASKYSR